VGSFAVYGYVKEGDFVPDGGRDGYEYEKDESADTAE
jgi:hypothetical protein